MSVPGRHVIIVGGGASGALLAIGLLRLPQPPAVTIIERRQLLARGFAYGEAAPFHLLNVRAANMSAYQDVPDHFLQWLDGRAPVPGVTGEGRFRFAPRRVYGEYLAEQLHTLALAAGDGGRLQHIQGEAISLTRAETGLVVNLADGRQVRGEVVVLATGYGLRRPSDLPHSLPSWSGFEAESLAGIERVLVIGTGHSAIDHVQLLLAAGYGGKITMMSRHGFLPAVHRPVEPAKIEPGEIPFGVRLSEIWRWFRKRADVAERQGGDWRAELDGMRPHAHAFWQAFRPEDQRRFIRHARAWYDVRRHRMAPSITATLERLRAEGRLDVISGRIVTVRDGVRDAVVVYRHRGELREHELRVQGIIECTGFDLNPRTSRNPLLADLLAQGLAVEGQHGFGVKVTPSCALIDAEGRPETDLFAVGPLTRGQFWETVGLPDVRQQCARVAAAIGSHEQPAT